MTIVLNDPVGAGGRNRIAPFITVGLLIVSAACAGEARPPKTLPQDKDEGIHLMAAIASFRQEMMIP